jgi:hypothetical protein
MCTVGTHILFGSKRGVLLSGKIPHSQNESPIRASHSWVSNSTHDEVYPRSSWELWGLSTEENTIDFPKETVEAPLPQPVVSLLTDLWQAFP